MFFSRKKQTSLTTHICYDNERISIQNCAIKIIKKVHNDSEIAKERKIFSQYVIMIALVCTIEIL